MYDFSIFHLTSMKYVNVAAYNTNLVMDQNANCSVLNKNEVHNINCNLKTFYLWV